MLHSDVNVLFCCFSVLHSNESVLFCCLSELHSDVSVLFCCPRVLSSPSLRVMTHEGGAAGVVCGRKVGLAEGARYPNLFEE